jgi:Tfp pilus assembly protein FimV
MAQYEVPLDLVLNEYRQQVSDLTAELMAARVVIKRQEKELEQLHAGEQPLLPKLMEGTARDRREPAAQVDQERPMGAQTG